MSDAFQVVRDFEVAVADYAGARFGVAVDSCTSAIFLSLMWRKHRRELPGIIDVPKRTYPSVPMAVVHTGSKIRWTNEDWRGCYHLSPSGIVDAAKRFRCDMFVVSKKRCQHDNLMMCMSFHAKKLLPVGRGGMILTDDLDAARWLRMARFDGRAECPLSMQEDWPVIGWNMYLSPDSAARGLWLMNEIKEWYEDQLEIPPYPDCSTFSCFSGYTA